MLFDSLKEEPTWFGFRYTNCGLELPYVLLNCGYGILRPGTSYSWCGMSRGNERRIIWQYTLSGLGRLRAGTKQYDLGAGSSFMVEIPSDHRYFFPSESKEWRFIYATLSGMGSLFQLGEVLHRVGPIAAIPSTSRTLVEFERLYGAAANEKLDYVTNSILAYSLAAAIHADFGNTSSVPSFISAVIDYCRKEMAHPICIEDMADRAGLSRYHFSREFRRFTGGTPAVFLRKIRLEKARRLLRETPLPVKEISFLCGFRSCNHFCRVFRAEYRMSPGDFRNSYPIFDNKANF